jgi:ribosomal protein S18 acetylase RimI-like enzyme
MDAPDSPEIVSRYPPGMSNPLTQSAYDLRHLAAEDLLLISQVDRSETNVANYLAVPSEDGLGLRLSRVAVDPPSAIGPWSDADVKTRVSWWKPEVEAGGLLVGAFSDEKLCGFGVLGPVQKDGSIELHALFVDAGCRRSGIGELLLNELERAATNGAAVSIWCASNRTASAVEFYLKHGYRPMSLNDNTLVPHRTGDPVLAKSLRSNGVG